MGAMLVDPSLLSELTSTTGVPKYSIFGLSSRFTWPPRPVCLYKANAARARHVSVTVVTSEYGRAGGADRETTGNSPQPARGRLSDDHGDPGVLLAQDAAQQPRPLPPAFGEPGGVRGVSVDRLSLVVTVSAIGQILLRRG